MSNGFYISFGWDDFTSHKIPRSHPDFQKMLENEELCQQDSMISHPEITKEDLIVIMKNSYDDTASKAIQKLGFTVDDLRTYVEEAFESKKCNFIATLYSNKAITDDEMHDYLMNNDLFKRNDYSYYSFVSDISTIYKSIELFSLIWKRSSKVHYAMMHGIEFNKGFTDPEIYRFLENEYFSGKFNNGYKERFASLNGLTEEAFYKLSDEKARPIILSLAQNKSLPSKLQWEFVSRFKTPNIREAICRVTDDRDLLHHVYNNTTSKSIKDIAQNNPAF